ncbi:MAG: hypothetical protein L0H23_08345 [Luteimonas sp.]|nr:hypothetical protein [Luteimonas sp.]
MHDKTIAMLLLAALVPAAAAAALPDPVTGVYSSLHTSEETGDTGGMRAIVLASNRDYYAVLQCAGSVLDRPVVVLVKVDEAAATLAFAAHHDPDNECPMEAFSAKFEQGGLRPQYPGGYEPGLLRPTRGIAP